MIKSTLDDQIKITKENIKSLETRLKIMKDRLQLLYEQRAYRDFKIRKGSIVKNDKGQYLVSKIYFSSSFNYFDLDGYKIKKNGKPSKVANWIGRNWEIEKS